MSRVSHLDYRALVRREGGPSGGSLVHLIRDGSEAALCGTPRPALVPGGVFDEVVCPDCIEWLPKRMAATQRNPRAKPDA
jgi:hypothetical protein